MSIQSAPVLDSLNVALRRIDALVAESRASGRVNEAQWHQVLRATEDELIDLVNNNNDLRALRRAAMDQQSLFATLPADILRAINNLLRPNAGDALEITQSVQLWGSAHVYKLFGLSGDNDLLWFWGGYPQKLYRMNLATRQLYTVAYSKSEPTDVGHVSRDGWLWFVNQELQLAVYSPFGGGGFWSFQEAGLRDITSVYTTDSKVYVMGRATETAAPFDRIYVASLDKARGYQQTEWPFELFAKVRPRQLQGLDPDVHYIVQSQLVADNSGRVSLVLFRDQNYVDEADYPFRQRRRQQKQLMKLSVYEIIPDAERYQLKTSLMAYESWRAFTLRTGEVCVASADVAWASPHAQFVVDGENYRAEASNSVRFRQPATGHPLKFAVSGSGDSLVVATEAMHDDQRYANDALVVVSIPPSR